LGILVIVALGVSFFSGLGVTGMNMKLTGDAYFNAQRLMDIRVVSNFGLTKEDISALREISNVYQVFPSHSIDAMVMHNDIGYVVKMHSLEAVNRPVITSGRLPERPGEALVEAGFLGLGVGDVFRLSSGNDTDIRVNLLTDTFQVVGIAQSPYYISTERGTGTIGDGSVSFFIYVDTDNFTQPLYSEAFILLDGVEELSSFGDEYQTIVDNVISDIESLADIRVVDRYHAISESIYNRLQLARTQLRTRDALARLELDEGQNRLMELQTALDLSYFEMPRMQASLDESGRELNAHEAQILSGLREVFTAEIELNARERELIYNERNVWERFYALDNETAELVVSAQALAVLDMTLLENRRLQEDQINALSRLNADYETLNRSIAEIESGKREINEARNELIETRSSLRDSLLEVSVNRSALYMAQHNLFVSSFEIEAGRLELHRAKSDLLQSRVRISRDLSSARAEIDRSQEALDDLRMPVWHVLDRHAIPGYASFSGDADKITAIGRVFPLVFFLVAALVCLTTMTRLVDERRMEIGVLKSLGYGNLSIISKYIFYAAVPTILGGLIGGYVGMKLFPSVIIDAYRTMYSLPEASSQISFGYWAVGLGIALLCTVSASAASCFVSLREVPAKLIRPKTPKASDRMFLERIGFIWDRLTFIQKVTLRNIVRYKKRFFMTVIGISGCTALLLTGFGIRDSVSSIMSLQFEEITLYDMTISFADSARQQDISRVEDLLRSNASSQGFITLRAKMKDAINPEANLTPRQFTLVVTEDTDNLDRFIVLRDRATGETIPAPTDGVVITEKLSDLLSLGIGDQILLKDGNESAVTATVTGIAENYIFHYVYMNSELYEQLYGDPPEYNTIYALLNNDGTSALARELLDKRSVNTIAFTQNQINNMNDVLSSLNFVMLILILSAGALAFVVLMNLSSINISERMRELATLEVLGFYDKEIFSYIFRENTILTIIGAFVGLGFGMLLHLYVLLSAETEIMMFGRDIHPMSYIYSIALTVVFSVVANIFSSRKLKQIQMVEALKSAE